MKEMPAQAVDQTSPTSSSPLSSSSVASLSSTSLLLLSWITLTTSYKTAQFWVLTIWSVFTKQKSKYSFVSTKHLIGWLCECVGSVWSLWQGKTPSVSAASLAQVHLVDGQKQADWIFSDVFLLHWDWGLYVQLALPLVIFYPSTSQSGYLNYGSIMTNN